MTSTNTQEFEYMMLNRLQSDCYGYFRYNNKLWGITAKAHADEMLKLWNCLKVKPEWLTKSELISTIEKLTKKHLDRDEIKD